MKAETKTVPDFNDPIEVEKLKKSAEDARIREKYEKLEARMNKCDNINFYIINYLILNLFSTFLRSNWIKMIIFCGIGLIWVALRIIV